MQVSSSYLSNSLSGSELSNQLPAKAKPQFGNADLAPLLTAQNALLTQQNGFWERITKRYAPTAAEIKDAADANQVQGFFSKAFDITGKLGTGISSLSSLVSGASTIANLVVGHRQSMQRLERSSEINKELQKLAHEKKTEQNYQVAASAAAVIGLGIFAAAKGMAWVNAKRLAQQLAGSYERIDAEEIQKSHFKDLVGHKDLKTVLEGEILSRVKYPELFPKDSDSSAILYGPPGTGKTFSIKCLANEAIQSGMPVDVITLNAGRLVSEPGIASRVLDKLHDDIRSLNGQKVFLILDEADSLGSRDKLGAGSEASKAINTLLQKIDGINGFKNVSLFAMTNRLEDLDDAFTNRIRHQILVDKPHTGDLGQMFNHDINRQYQLQHGDFLKLVPPSNLDMKTITQAAEGFTGRSVKNSINNLIDRVILENLGTLKAQKEAALKQHVPPQPSTFQKLTRLFVESPPPPPPVITYKISFTEAQLLSAIKQVKGTDTIKSVKQGLTKPAYENPINPFQTFQTAELNGKGLPYPPKGMDMPFRLVGSNGIQTVLPGAAPAA